jgi:hypothetical protein
MVDSADLGFYGAAWRFTDFCQHLSAGSVYLQFILKSCELPGVFRVALHHLRPACRYQVSDIGHQTSTLKHHFMPSLIRKLFHKSEAPKDGLAQPQREAIVDLLNYCMYADNFVFLAEDRLIADTVAKFNWASKVPFDQFDVRSIDNARNAREHQGYRDRFLASIRDRLGTAAVKGHALDLCQELFVADGALADEEDAVLQNLRKLLE